MSDFDAWDPGGPPPDFAERVARRALAERRRHRARRRAIAAASIAAASCALVAGWWVARVDDRGERIATGRIDMAIGRDAAVELDLGAHIEWDVRRDAMVVTQRSGGASYRVRSGARTPLRVTAAGAIVTATGGAKLRVVVRDPAPRADGEGDAMIGRGKIVGATAFAVAAAWIAVIEGRATITRGGSALDVGAGEGAVVDDDGARRVVAVDSMESAEARFATGADPEKPEWPSRDPAVREALRARILAALQGPALPPGSPVAAPPITAAPADASDFEPSYIRDRVHEDFMPLGEKCYVDALASHPTLHGKIIVHFKIVGDEKVGGIVDEASIDEKSTLKDAALAECIRQSMMTVSFKPPPRGGWSTVTYPFVFSPDADGGEDDE